MKKTVLSNSLPKLCLAMGLMLGTGAWNAYALPEPQQTQQTRNTVGKVTGTVLDENGEPIIGASVKVKGAEMSAATDIDGRFTFGKLSPNQEIEVSYVGYVPTSLKVSKLEALGGGNCSLSVG